MKKWFWQLFEEKNSHEVIDGMPELSAVEKVILVVIICAVLLIAFL